MSNQSNFFIGIDGGGTKCKARLEDDRGNLLAETIVGPANAARDLKGSMDAVVQASEQLLQIYADKNLTLDQIHAGIGLAGINLPFVKKAAEEITLPFASTVLTTDLHIACLGAHQGQDGAIVIIGTGSSGVAITDDHQWEVGGHGFVVGDKGSGAWIGRKAISLTLETLDGIYPSNGLSEAILKRLDCHTAVDVMRLTINAKPAVYAQLAPLVLHQAQLGQSEALTIIQRGANYIGQLTQQLLRHNPPRISFIGGISTPLMPYLAESIRQKCQPAICSPEQGAIILAKSSLVCQ